MHTKQINLFALSYNDFGPAVTQYTNIQEVYFKERGSFRPFYVFIRVLPVLFCSVIVIHLVRVVRSVFNAALSGDVRTRKKKKNNVRNVLLIILSFFIRLLCKLSFLLIIYRRLLERQPTNRGNVMCTGCRLAVYQTFFYLPSDHSLSRRPTTGRHDKNATPRCGDDRHSVHTWNEELWTTRICFMLPKQMCMVRISTVCSW